MHEFKPMDLGTILDKTFRLIFTKNYFKLAGIFILFIIVISIIIAGLFFASFGFNFVEKFDNIEFSPKIFMFSSVFLLLIPLFIYYSIMFSGMTTDLFLNKFLDKEWTLKSSFKRTTKRFWDIFLYYFLFGIVILGLLPLYFLLIFLATGINSGYIFSMIFTIFLMLGFYLLFFLIILFFILGLPSLLFENNSAIKAIKRSIKLVKLNFWKIFGASLLFYVILIFASYLILFILGILFLLIGVIIGLMLKINFNESGFNLIVIMYIAFILLYSIISIFQSGINFAFSVVIYFNQKIKHENFGVELLVKSMVIEHGQVDEIG